MNDDDKNSHEFRQALRSCGTGNDPGGSAAVGGRTAFAGEMANG